jgi:hypothetical protein
MTGDLEGSRIRDDNRQVNTRDSSITIGGVLEEKMSRESRHLCDDYFLPVP